MPNRIGSLKGKNIQICLPHCSIVSSYLFFFFSLRNNIPLENGDKYNFNEDGSEMTIQDVTKLDEGDYTCIALNKAGKSEQELSLKVFGKNP